MKVTERTIWGGLVAIWLIGIFVFFLYQRSIKKENNSPGLKYVSLPEEISKIKSGDTLTIDINDDTLLIRYFHKGQNLPEENYVIIK